MAMRIGVIGYGYWGPNLLRNFVQLEDCFVAAVADGDPKKLETAKKFYPWIEAFSSGETLIEKGNVDAVVIATPISTHYPLAKAALSKGKHVLIEKPMAMTSKQAAELIALSKSSGKTLMVDHTFVYSGAVQMIRKLIDSGEFGDIYYYDSVRVNLGLFQHDVNVLWDLAPHDLSVMLYLIDKQPESLCAIGAKPVHTNGWNLESIAYAVVRFPKETIAHFHVNWLSPVKVRRTLIGGAKKMIVYDHLDPDNQIKIFDKGVDFSSKQQLDGALLQYRTGSMFAPKIDQSEALLAVCRHFVDCAKSGKPPITGGHFGLSVVRLLELAQESMDHDGKNIKIEEPFYADARK